MVMVKPVSTIDDGTLVNLGTEDSVTVDRNVILVASSGSAIIGSGSNQQAIINGTLMSTEIAIYFNDFNSTGYSVTLGDTAQIYAIGSTGSGIGCIGTDITVTNHGYVDAANFGVAFAGISTTTHSTLVNTGTIKADLAAVVRGAFSTTEAIQVRNSGLIESADTAYGYQNAGHIATDVIINTGEIIGAVKLDGGDDTYNGRKGTIDGDVYGGDGLDILTGGKEANIFYGDAGADKLTGGLGADTLTGGADADQFIYLSMKDSTSKVAGQDVINDFSQSDADHINLKAIDADIKAKGDQKFDFIEDHAFTGDAGELRFKVILDDTFIYGDTNGDKKADFVIRLDAAMTLVAGDFIL